MRPRYLLPVPANATPLRLLYIAPMSAPRLQAWAMRRRREASTVERMRERDAAFLYSLGDALSFSEPVLARTCTASIDDVHEAIDMLGTTLADPRKTWLHVDDVRLRTDDQRFACVETIRIPSKIAITGQAIVDGQLVLGAGQSLHSQHRHGHGPGTHVLREAVTFLRLSSIVNSLQTRGCVKPSWIARVDDDDGTIQVQLGVPFDFVRKAHEMGHFVDPRAPAPGVLDRFVRGCARLNAFGVSHLRLDASQIDQSGRVVSPLDAFAWRREPYLPSSVVSDSGDTCLRVLTSNIDLLSWPLEQRRESWCEFASAYVRASLARDGILVDATPLRSTVAELASRDGDMNVGRVTPRADRLDDLIRAARGRVSRTGTSCAVLRLFNDSARPRADLEPLDRSRPDHELGEALARLARDTQYCVRRATSTRSSRRLFAPFHSRHDVLVSWVVERDGRLVRCRHPVGTWIASDEPCIIDSLEFRSGSHRYIQAIEPILVADKMVDA